MARGRVLLIEADGGVADRLAESLRAKGYEVVVYSDARGGFEAACSVMPDCILCNVELPDIDGYWVARRLRTEPGPVSTTPFMFLAETDDEDACLQGLHVGADVFLSMPFTHDEVEAQLSALIDMARRLRARRDSFLNAEPQSTRGDVALRGDLGQIPLASILMMLEMERRSGQLKVTSEGNTTAIFSLMGGTFVRSEMNGVEGVSLDVLRDVLRWRTGKFSFTSLNTPHKATPRVSIGEMLLTAMQMEDESRR